MSNAYKYKLLGMSAQLLQSFWSILEVFALLGGAEISFVYIFPFFSGIHFSYILSTISMNLFDQLVIIICNPIMEG